MAPVAVEIFKKLVVFVVKTCYERIVARMENGVFRPIGLAPAQLHAGSLLFESVCAEGTPTYYVGKIWLQWGKLF